VIARHYATGDPVEIEHANGTIVRVSPAAGPPEGWVAPALFDLQINGCRGIS
jgi:hypothetical protein